MSNLVKSFKNIVNLPRNAKRTITIILDIGLCVICTWLAFYLRLEEFIKINDITILAVLISIFISIPIFSLLGLYNTMIRFTGLSIIFSISVAVFIYGILYFSVIGVYGIQGIPRSIGLIQPLLLFLGILSSRLFIKYLLVSSYSSNYKSRIKKKILIYGAGSAGRQLLSVLENNNEMKVVGFLDDDKQLHNQLMLGQTVFSPSNLEYLIKSKNINSVLLALPSITKVKRNEILENLNNYPIKIKTLPSIQDIVEGKISVDDIKDLAIEDLLNREQIQPNFELLLKNIDSKVVLVTGAGGSIGSELCNQIIKLNRKN